MNTGGNLTVRLGALQGGANTKITRQPDHRRHRHVLDRLRGDSTTFAGIFRDNPTLATGLVALTKVGTGTLTLTGASTHTGATTATGAGVLLLSGAGGSVATSPVSDQPGGHVLHRQHHEQQQSPERFARLDDEPGDVELPGQPGRHADRRSRRR